MEDHPEVEWACSVCAFLNKPMHLSCSMCSTKRPESAIAVAGLIEGNSGGESKASVEANFKCSPRQRLEILGFTQEDGWSFMSGTVLDARSTIKWMHWHVQHAMKTCP